MKHAFTDSADGYYEVDVADGEPMPEWTQRLTPCEVRPYVPLFNRDAAMDRLRDIRALILNALAGIGFDALTANDTATVDGVKAARQGLKDLPAWPAVANATNDDDFTAAVKARYAELVAAAPESVRVAFREVA